jgi:hypothetical protein
MSKINKPGYITIYAMLAVLFLFLPEREVFSAPKCAVLDDKVQMCTRKAVSDKSGFYQLVEDMFDVVIPQTDSLPFGKSVAFLAGVSDYEHLSPQLPFVKNDLEDMREFLLTKGGFDTVYIAYGDIVNRDLIETYIKDKLPKEHSKHDRLLFYYSGHGADSGGRTGYMQFSGARPGNFAGNQVMPMNDAVDWSSELHFSHILVIFDSCSSGLGFAPKGDTAGEPYIKMINTLSRNGSRIVLTAGTAEEKTFEVESPNGHGNGVFTRAFLNAIESGMADRGRDGFMTIDEVIARVKEGIAAFSVKSRQTVTPQMWPLEVSSYPGSFVFVNPESRNSQIHLQQEYAEKLNAQPRPKGQDADAFGKIYLISFITGKVYIDGNYWEDIESGKAKIIKPVSTGAHTIEVKGTKGNASQTVEVRQGERTDVTIDLPEGENVGIKQPVEKPEIVKSQPSLTPEPKIKLRSEPITLSKDEVKTMLKEKGFSDRNWNTSGKGIDNIYEEQEKNGDKVVVDKVTGLTWQHSGSPDSMTYADAKKYIQKLNNDGFAGYKDWRLPTLEEAMSLMEPTRKNKDLYIDPLFDSTQRWIWTADMKSSSVAWVVHFNLGYCNFFHVGSTGYYVRGVR